MTPTFILITKYSGQECVDLYRSERDLLSAAADFEPHEIDFAAELKLTDDGVRTWEPLTDAAVSEAIRERTYSHGLRAHERMYAAGAV